MVDVGGLSSLWEVLPHGMREQSEQAPGSKPISSTPPQPLLQLPLPRLPPQLPSMVQYSLYAEKNCYLRNLLSVHILSQQQKLVRTEFEASLGYQRPGVGKILKKSEEAL